MPVQFRHLLFVFVLIAGCSETRPFLRKPAPDAPLQIGDPNLRPIHTEVLTFYALGDWGSGDENQQAVANALQRNVAEIPANRKIPPFVVGLGDNVYEFGLAEGWNHPTTRLLLEKTFGQIYQDVRYQGQKLNFHVVPGNHDYNGVAGGKNGWGDVIQQETAAEKLYYPNWQYYPIDPAKNRDSNDSTDYFLLKKENIYDLTLPEKINLPTDSKISVVALDTQVLLELYKKKNHDLLQKHWQRLESLLEEDAAWKIVIGHHAVSSHGRHAGFREWFWWVPPIILYTVIDKLFIKTLQDMDHPAHQHFVNDLKQLIRKHDVTLYLSGHEHSLEFLQIDPDHFQIVSGSAGKLTEVSHKNDTIFSHEAFGFVRFDITDHEMWIEFFQVKKDASFGSTALFRLTK
ncbi:MAG: metallophosphoesterase [bacterium]